MTFEEELRRVIDQLADHLRHEAAGKLQASMPDLYDAQMSEQREAVGVALTRAREEADREFAERIDAIRREAAEQLDAARKEAADRLAASEQLATEQLANARRDHEEHAASLQRDTSEQLQAKERDIAERLEAREREIAELLDARTRDTAEQLEALERQALERAEAAVRDAQERAEASIHERLQLVESTTTERIASAAAEAEARAHDAGRAEGRKEGREALADAFLALGKARSLSEVLDALSLAAQRETAAVAVVIVRGTQVRTWKLSGFGEAVDTASAFDIALTDAGIIREAVQAGSLVRGNSSQEQAIPGFAAPTTTDGAARALAAVPLVVGGQVVAVLYGDGPAEAGTGWQTSFDALASCASRLLEALTAFRTATLLKTGTRG